MKDSEVIKKLRKENEEFKKLEDDHRKLDEYLEEMSKKKYLTAEEEMEKKTLQKKKLHYKDKMAQLIKEGRQSA
jgi:uncharacterized protein YdcH (DUF465 family)